MIHTTICLAPADKDAGDLGPTLTSGIAEGFAGADFSPADAADTGGPAIDPTVINPDTSAGAVRWAGAAQSRGDLPTEEPAGSEREGRDL